ncbi:TPA: ATP-binding protein [Stenotrophomonas maltophilia]
MVNRTLHILARSIGPSIEIETRSDRVEDVVRVDAPQLENALLNLCINERDATPDGGRISIEAELSHVDGGLAERLVLTPGPYVRLSVRDTGTGMDASVVEKVFEPFFTTKPIG